MTRGGMADFHEETELVRAREALRDVVSPIDRTETLPLADADCRVLASGVEARADVPHYARAAMDGYAVRAADTAGASDADPATLELTEGEVGAGAAARVQTGTELPAGADTVVRLERAAETPAGDVEVGREVPEGKDVAPVGEDVREGQHLYDPGHRLRPSDLGLLKSAGVRAVEVRERPTASVLPTGAEVVDADPARGEVVDANGPMVSRYVERWGGVPRSRDPVADETDALAAALRDARDADLVVTIGGSSVGDGDVVPEVVDELGDLLVHGVAVKPGHPVGVGVVAGTPVLLVPGYPVSAVVNAVQFLRPALHWLAGTEPKPLPAVRATLTGAIESDPGTRRYARVRLESGAGDGADGDGPAAGAVTDARWTTPGASESTPAATESTAGAAGAGEGVGEPEPALRATPTTHSGAGVLSSVALADGWVEVPEDASDLPAGTAVTVQDWEWGP